MLETQRIPVFSGYINIQSSNNESFHLPYFGIDCNMKQVIVTYFEIRSPYISNSSDTSSIPAPIVGSGDRTEVVGVNVLGSVPDFPQFFL
jgi:hypothetical protein